MSELDERQQTHLDEMNALRDRYYPEKFWGFLAIPGHKVLLIGSELSEEERAEMVALLPSFNSISFLAGPNEETCKEYARLVQRILIYGGTLPNLKWASRDNDWADAPNQCGIYTAEVITLRRDPKEPEEES